MNPLRMAVIGAGALGRHHARILSQLPGVELVAVAESRPEQGQTVAESCSTRWVQDFHEILDDVDAVSVVVPTSAHLEVASEFLRRGVHVMVEKPLAMTVDQGRVLVKLAENHDAILQVGHIERFNAATQAAWPLCGAPKYIRAERLSPYPFRSMDIGVVLDLMIHDLDLVLDLVDAPLRSVDALGICVMGGNEDIAQARLTFDNGCVADLTASRLNPEPERSFQVWSADGCVKIDFTKPEVSCFQLSDSLRQGMSPVERAQQPNADIAQLKQDVFGNFIQIQRPEIEPQDALTAELASFAECVRNNRPPIVDGMQGLAALSAAERVLKSVEAHEWDGNALGAVGPFARHLPLRKFAG